MRSHITVLILLLFPAFGQAQVLGDVFPVSAINNRVYCTNGNAVLFGQVSERRPAAVRVPHPAHILFSQFLGKFFASRHAALLLCVIKIVLVCSKKEMAWSHAKTIIAAMANFQAVSNRAVGQLPRYAVNFLALLVPRDRAVGGFALSAKANPYPAPIRFAYSAPESLIERARGGIASLTGTTAKFSSLSTHTATGRGEYALAI
jgi:hypothetical protein